MTKRPFGFSGPWPWGAVLGLALLTPLSAQTAPAPDWGRDYEGRAMVAVLPLAGEETEMIAFFQTPLEEAVAALGKYHPIGISPSVLREAEIEIPTDMPPLRSLTAGARYSLTGGVYPGNREGAYYLQLWLWDMAGTTMIYTDDLVYYDDPATALEGLSGLVEWLFSHIREVVIEPPPPLPPPDPPYGLGLWAGLSPRFYTKPPGNSSGASYLGWQGGLWGTLRLASFLALRLELALSADIPVYRGLNYNGGQYVMVNRKFSNLSLMVPLVITGNFRLRGFRLSPLAGFYGVFPLGETRYRDSAGAKDAYPWSFSLPLGWTAGLEGAVIYGPGRVVAGLRFSADFGTVTIRNSEERQYRRNMASLYLGYEFGFYGGKSRGED